MDEKRANLWPPLSSQVFACFILNSFLQLIGCWSASIPQRFFHLLMLYIPRWESEELAAATTLPPLRQAETVGAFSREQTAVFIRIFMGAEGQLRGSSSAAYSMQSNSFTQRDRTWARIQRLDGRNAKELKKKKKLQWWVIRKWILLYVTLLVLRFHTHLLFITHFSQI